MIKRKFDKQFLRELTWREHSEEYEVIKNEIYDTSRWSVHYEMIFKFEDKYYQTCYSRGATESQDEMPYQYESDVIECIEVVPVSRTIITYEPKDD